MADGLEYFEEGTIANSEEGVVKIIGVDRQMTELYGETYYNCRLLETGDMITLMEEELDTEDVEYVTTSSWDEDDDDTTSYWEDDLNWDNDDDSY